MVNLIYGRERGGRFWSNQNEGLGICIVRSFHLPSREEREWREWADSSLVLVVVPTMFRTLGESLRSFDYAEEISSFNSFERLAVKYIGGVAMYFVGKYMRRK